MSDGKVLLFPLIGCGHLRLGTNRSWSNRGFSLLTCHGFSPGANRGSSLVTDHGFFLVRGGGVQTDRQRNTSSLHHSLLRKLVLFSRQRKHLFSETILKEKPVKKMSLSCPDPL